MAYGTNESLQIPGLLAGESLASSQYHVVKMGATAGEVKLVNSTSNVAIGVLQNNPADGEVAEVVVLGVTKAKAGGTITAGALLGWNTTARLVAVTGDNTGVFAIAPEAASSGDICTIILTGYNRR